MLLSLTTSLRMRAPRENTRTMIMIKKLMKVLNLRSFFLTFRFYQLMSLGYEAGSTYRLSILYNKNELSFSHSLLI